MNVNTGGPAGDARPNACGAYSPADFTAMTTSWLSHVDISGKTGPSSRRLGACPP